MGTGMAEGTPDIQQMTARMLNQEAAGDLAGAARTLVGMFEWPVELRVSTSDEGMRRALWEANDRRCFYTGRDVAFEEMAVDHIVPRHLGGPDHLWNYAPTTPSINSKKRAAFSARHAAQALHINRVALLKDVSWIRRSTNYPDRAEKLAATRAAKLAGLRDPALMDLRWGIHWVEPDCVLAPGGLPPKEEDWRRLMNRERPRGPLRSCLPPGSGAEINAIVRMVSRNAVCDPIIISGSMAAQAFIHYVSVARPCAVRGADLLLLDTDPYRVSVSELMTRVRDVVAQADQMACEAGDDLRFKVRAVTAWRYPVPWETRVHLTAEATHQNGGRISHIPIYIPVGTVDPRSNPLDIVDMPTWAEGATRRSLPCTPLEAAYVSRVLETMSLTTLDHPTPLILRRYLRTGSDHLSSAFDRALSRMDDVSLKKLLRSASDGTRLAAEHDLLLEKRHREWKFQGKVNARMLVCTQLFREDLGQVRRDMVAEASTLIQAEELRRERDVAPHSLT